MIKRILTAMNLMIMCGVVAMTQDPDGPAPEVGTTMVTVAGLSGEIGTFSLADDSATTVGDLIIRIHRESRKWYSLIHRCEVLSRRTMLSTLQTGDHLTLNAIVAPQWVGEYDAAEDFWCCGPFRLRIMVDGTRILPQNYPSVDDLLKQFEDGLYEFIHWEHNFYICGKSVDAEGTGRGHNIEIYCHKKIIGKWTILSVLDSALGMETKDGQRFTMHLSEVLDRIQSWLNQQATSTAASSSEERPVA